MNDTSDVDEQLEELREEESSGNKLERDSAQTQRSFAEKIVQGIDAVDDPTTSDSATLSFHDKNLAGLFVALEDDDGRREEVAEALSEKMGHSVDTEDVTRSQMLKLAVRVGLQEADPQLMEEAEEAANQRDPNTF